MKSKRVLYLLAGIINCVFGGICAMFGIFILLFKNLISTTFEKGVELLNEFAKAMASADPQYEYLLEASNDEIIKVVMNFVSAVCVIALIFGAIIIALGVFNIILSKKHLIIFAGKKWLKVVLVVVSWLVCIFNVANILTTIAVCLKDKNSVELDGLYSAHENG